MQCQVKTNNRPTKSPFVLSNSNSLADYFREIWDPNLLQKKQQFYAMFFNSKDKFICCRLLSTGDKTGYLADVNNLALVTLQCNAEYVVIAHNNPKCILKPSLYDLAITRKISAVMKLLKVTLIDHVILTPKAHITFDQLLLM